MQRTISRARFPTVDSAGVPVSECMGHRMSVAWTLCAGFIFALASRGLATAANQDNVLLDFTASWCGPCQQMSSIVSGLERQGFPIRKVDVDREPGLAAKFKVQSIPCFILVANGEELDRVTGATTEQQLRGMLNRLPKPAPVARTVPEDRRNETRQPGLGIPVPVTPPSKDSKPPRQLPPTLFDTKESDQQPPADPGIDQPIARGNTPEPNPVRSSVRIRVKDGNAINYGSGTIIDSQLGHATILTCGHIFRKLSKGAVIEVDLFTSTTSKSAKPETVPGHVLLTDLDADVGLVRINHPKRLPTVPLGLSGVPLAVKERLFSIGCSGGDIPSREDLELTGINRYDGPDNLECTRRPQQGRSGGGLFRDDALVGVCVAADPKLPRGIYAGLQPIGLLLQKAGLTHLVPRTPAIQPTNSTLANDSTPANDQKSNGGLGLTTGSLQVATTDDDVAQLLAREMGGAVAGASTRNAAGATPDFAGAEIICIVRSKTPGQPSRVVIVNQASETFVADLLHESGGGTGRPARDPLYVREQATDSTPRRPVETSLELKPYRRSDTK